jgi:hypothetical protein
MIPKNMDREAFAERKKLCAEYLGRIARASGEQRKELLVECAEKLYDAQAGQRVGLLESLDNIHLLLADLHLFYSGTIIPLLARANPDDFESEAISLAIAGQESHWLAKIVLLFPTAVAKQNSDQAARGSRVASQDPIAAKRRAWVDAYIREVFLVKKKRITRSDIWKAAGYKEATAFERWQRNDHRSSKSDDRAFTRVLTEKPHLK